MGSGKHKSYFKVKSLFKMNTFDLSLVLQIKCFPVHDGPLVMANKRKIYKGGVILLQNQLLSSNYPRTIMVGSLKMWLDEDCLSYP